MIEVWWRHLHYHCFYVLHPIRSSWWWLSWLPGRYCLRTERHRFDPNIIPDVSDRVGPGFIMRRCLQCKTMVHDPDDTRWLDGDLTEIPHGRNYWRRRDDWWVI